MSSRSRTDHCLGDASFSASQRWLRLSTPTVPPLSCPTTRILPTASCSATRTCCAACGRYRRVDIHVTKLVRPPGPNYCTDLLCFEVKPRAREEVVLRAGHRVAGLENLQVEGYGARAVRGHDDFGDHPRSAPTLPPHRLTDGDGRTGNTTKRLSRGAEACIAEGDLVPASGTRGPSRSEITPERQERHP